MEKLTGRSGRYRLSFSLRCIVPVFVAWSGAAVYALSEDRSFPQKLAEVPIAAGMIVFVFLHGLRRYGPRTLLVFTAQVFLIAWCSEMLSITTGFPFGSYTYTEIMRPHIGHVPAIVLPVYWVMGYVCWSMAQILLCPLGPHTGRKGLIFLPLVAAALMVTWDLSMDPLRSTLEMRWIWADGGVHYGVPTSNFFGWFLVTWTMFQSFALYLRSRRGDGGENCGSSSLAPIEQRSAIGNDGIGFWIAVPLMYLTFAIEHILRPFSERNADQTVVINGTTATLSDFVSDIALLTAGTMVPIAAVALWLVVRKAPSPVAASTDKGP